MDCAGDFGGIFVRDMGFVQLEAFGFRGLGTGFRE